MRRRSSTLEHPAFLVRVSELGPASDRTWLLGLFTGLLFTVIAAVWFSYPASMTGKFWAYAGLLIRASLYLWAGDALRGRGGEALSRLLGLGLVAGSFELLVDWWLIHGVSSGRLVYLTGNDVVLLGSPVWMPLAWACVIVELGYPALRLFHCLVQSGNPRRAALMASLACGAAASLTVGVYEYLAYRAGWWKYEPARAMIGKFCALYIPLGEFVMFLAIVPIAARVLADEKRSCAAAIVGGARFAVAIAAGYALAYVLLECR